MDSDNSNSMDKTRQKGKAKRRCCVENCTGDEVSSSMFSFPNTIRTINGVKVQNEVQVERCKVWLQTIDQQDLKDIDISMLHGRFFLCDKHFNSEQFSNNNRKNLKRNAVPNSAAEVSCKIRKRNTVPTSIAEVDALDIESKGTATTAASEVVQVSNSITNMDNMEPDFSCLHYLSAEVSHGKS